MWLLFIILFILFLIAIVIVLYRKKIKKAHKSAEYPTIAENLSSDPNIIEVTLTSSDNEVQILNGDATKLFNYNNSFPGPLIEANKGDKLIVHFFNDLPYSSTITWHGLLNEISDTNKKAKAIEPGESFTYSFNLNNAGLFWYHSDIDVRKQVHKGLYGVIIVSDYKENEQFSIPVNEKILAFSDLKLNRKNQIEINDDNEIIGNVLLTNGVHEGYISIAKNVPVRLRMVNCSTDRFLKISIENHDILRIGGDQGLLEKPILIKEKNGLMLTTGERADIVFVPRFDNIKIFTESNPRGIQIIDKNHELNDVMIDKEKLLLVTLITTEEKDNHQLNIPLEFRRLRKIRYDHCTPIIPVTYGSTIENNLFAFKLNNSLRPEDVPIVFENGVYIIEITNTSSLANNFHIRGFSFQHIDTIFVVNNRRKRMINRILENKDTIYIPPKPKGSNSFTVVRLAIEFSKSGSWIFSSHILSNVERGQKGFIRIISECNKIDHYKNFSYSRYSDGDHSVCLTKSSK